MFPIGSCSYSLIYTHIHLNNEDYYRRHNKCSWELFPKLNLFVYFNSVWAAQLWKLTGSRNIKSNVETPQIFFFPPASNCIDSKKRKDFINTTEKVHITQLKKNINCFSFSKKLHMNNMEKYGQIILSLRHGQISSYCQGSAADVVNASDIFLDTDNLHWQILHADPVQSIPRVGWMFFICWTSIGYKIRFEHMYFNKFRIHLIRKHFKSQINFYFKGKSIIYHKCY